MEYVAKMWLSGEFQYNKKMEMVDESIFAPWGNDAASEVITEARQLLVENYFQTPSLAWVQPCATENFLKGSL